MHSTKITLGLVLLALTSITAPAVAQRAPTGAGVGLSALHPSERLGAGSLTGAGPVIKVGINPRLTLQASSMWYMNAQIEVPEADYRRVYNLAFPSVSLRASLAGEDTDFALLVGAGALRYDLDAFGGAPAEVVTVPTVGVGASFRVHLLGPLFLEFEGRDWMSYSRERELGIGRDEGGRGLAHNVGVRIALSALFQAREPSLATFEDLPLSYARDFRPVDASAVRAAPAPAAPSARDHVHRPDSQPEPITDEPASATVVRIPQAEIPSPLQQMTVAVPAPEVDWAERRLGTVYYRLGSHDVDDEYRPLLDDVASFLDQNPLALLEVRGFTDSSGSVRLNLSLAERRGTAVEELLSRLYDVDHERISVVSKGIDYRADSSQVARRAELYALIPQ